MIKLLQTQLISRRWVSQKAVTRLDRLARCRNLSHELANLYYKKNLNFIEEFSENYTPNYEHLKHRLSLEKDTYRDISDLIVSDKTETLEKINLLFPNNIPDLLRLLINQNKLILCIECMIKFIQHGKDVPYDIIQKLVDGLKWEIETQFVQLGYGLLQLVNHAKLEDEELTKIIDFLTSSIHGNYLANWIYGDLHKMGRLQTMPGYMEILLNTMEVNINNLNCFKFLEIWHENEIDYEVVDIDRLAKTLVTAFEQCETHRLDTLPILESLPEVMQSHDLIRDYRLKIYASDIKYKPQFNNFLNTLTHLNRSTMTYMLSGFLNYQDEPNAEKVIGTIFQKSGGLNKHELNMIIRKLLNQNKLQECLDMVQKMSWNDCKPSYISMFSHVLKSNLAHQFWEGLRSRLINQKEHPEFTVELVRFVTQNNVRQGIRLYTKIVELSNKSVDSDVFYLFLELSDYHVPDWFKRHLVVSTKTTMLECCQNIAIASIKQEDYDSTLWVFEQFRKLGWNNKDIFKLFQTYDTTNFITTIIKPKVLHACT